MRLATASDAPPKAARRGGTFSALRYRNFRLLWTGTLFSQGGDWLDQVALNWYVISTTGNPVLLGVINLARGVPLALFAMVGGAVADRVDRRRMMMVTQTLAMICAVAMSLLVAGGDPPILLLLAMTTLRGMLVAFNTPARQALLPATVPATELGSAVALHSVVLNTAKVLGPLTTAAILALWGVAACFLANAVTFVVLLVQLWLMRLPPAQARTGPREPLWRSLADGIGYIRRNDIIFLVVAVAVVPVVFAQPYLQLLALFAHDVFDTGSSGLGVMTAVAAAGSVVGGLFAAWVQREARRGDVLLAFMLGFGLSIICFALSPGLWVALPMLFVAGMMHIAYNSSATTILQLTVDDAYRGRVMATLFMTRGLVSVGTALTATLAAGLGARAAQASMAAVVVAFGLALWFRAPLLRRFRT